MRSESIACLARAAARSMPEFDLVVKVAVGSTGPVGEAQVFAISYQGINGNWSELRAGATWMFSHHFGVGLGYDRFATHVDLGKASFTGRLNFGYQGLLLYVKGGF